MSNASNISLWEGWISQSTPIPPLVEFWIYVISDGLSILCSLFVLYYLLFDRALRYALNNHIIIILLFMGLIYELTTVPWHLYRLRFGSFWIQNPTFYLVSYFFDYGIYTTQIILFAWATIERHILIFHDQWMSTKKKRLFIHYLPIVTILLYCLVFYSLVTFASFCEKSFEVFIVMDFYIPCVFSETALGTWDLFGHQGIATLIIVICSVTLIIRVLRQKRRINQPIQWRKYRKMTIQLISVSTLYLILNSPGGIMIFASHFGLSKSVATIPMIYILFFRNYIILLFPFVCCVSLPEIRRKLKRIVRWKRRNRVVPQQELEMAQIISKWTVKRNINVH